jgi:two-component system, NarL family, response regulator LiaR
VQAVSDARVRVAAVNDYDLVVTGLATMLSRFDDRLVVCDRIVVGEQVVGPVDVALYDTYGRVGVAGQALAALVADERIGRVAVFSWSLSQDLVDVARRAGASGFISKGLTGDAVADAVVRIARGEDVVAVPPPRTHGDEGRLWPGMEHGLTERQSEVLVLLADGLTNAEIAEALYVGLETVKTHLREVYVRLGVRNRAQATSYVRGSAAFGPHPPPAAPLHRLGLPG